MNPYELHLPNIRRAIVPDPGMVLVEADLARADAQVCAWDADCPTLKRIFAAGDDIHSDNARWLYGRSVEPRSLHTNGMSYRDNAKRAVHLTNYAGGPNTLAASCALPQQRARDFIHWWTREAHPEVGEWHDSTVARIRGRRMVVIHNAFGFRRVYSTRPDTDGRSLLGQVLAWICQSTVSIVINHVLLRLDCAQEMLRQPRCGKCLECRKPGTLRHALQIHDSALFQVPEERLTPELHSDILDAMRVTVPYPDPLVIPSEIKISRKSWGDLIEWHPT